LGFDEFKEYVEKHFHIWHKPTLALTEENIVQAYIVYQYGTLLGLTLHRAVIEVVGYRYRRLENFILNAALYNTKTHSWVHQNSLVKVKALYESKKKGSEIFEFQVETFRPFFLQRLDERFCKEIFYRSIEQTPFVGVLIGLEIGKWAYDDLEKKQTYLPYDECIQENEVVMQVTVKGLVYEYTLNATVSNYSIFELLKEGCEQYLEVVFKEERRLK